MTSKRKVITSAKKILAERTNTPSAYRSSSLRLNVPGHTLRSSSMLRTQAKMVQSDIVPPADLGVQFDMRKKFGNKPLRSSQRVSRPARSWRSTHMC